MQHEIRNSIIMLYLQECKEQLSQFRSRFGQHYGIDRLGIFGSVAREENTDDSDIDIVVEIANPTLAKMYELRESLSQLFGCKVDLIRYRDTLHPLLKHNIQKDAIYV